MKSKKNPINFNEFWPLLKTEAQRRGLRKVEWMQKSDLNYQRYSEFNNHSRDVSTRYFLKLLGGLNLKQESVEKVLGKRFSEEQRKSMRFESLVDANRDWLEILLSDPDNIKIVKKIISA